MAAMSGLQRIQRLLRLVEVLQSGRALNSAQLSEFCGVSRRTVFRDVETLRDSGVAVHFDEERQGYSMSSNRMLPSANFTLAETLSLLVLCQELSDERRGIPFQSAARSAALKLLSNLPHHLLEYLCQRMETIAVRIDAHSGQQAAAPHFELLTQAASERKQVRIHYNSLTEWTQITTVLSPYRILFSRRSWYVIGRSSLHRSIRTFNLGRIQNAERLATRYTIPQRFTLDRYLGNAWHLIRSKPREDVVIRFRKQVASNVAEVGWHKTQTLRWNGDGTLDFHATVDGMGEILWWILGYGAQAEVIEPPELRRMVASHVGQLANIYASEVTQLTKRPPAGQNGRSPKRRRR